MKNSIVWSISISLFIFSIDPSNLEIILYWKLALMLRLVLRLLMLIMQFCVVGVRIRLLAIVFANNRRFLFLLLGLMTSILFNTKMILKASIHSSFQILSIFYFVTFGRVDISFCLASPL
jgi:hypothetical protein